MLSLGGVCLLHTTQGELLRRFEVPQTTADRLRPCSVFNGVSTAGFGGSPMRVLASRHGYVIFQLGAAKIAVFTLNARLVAVTDLYRQVIVILSISFLHARLTVKVEVTQVCLSI